MASPTSLLPIHFGLMMASCPSALSRSPRSCASSRSISSMIREANSAYRVPASVRLMVRAVRLTRCTPSARSSSATCLDTREPEMPSARAAWLKLRDFVTPTKLRMIVSWSISLLAAEDPPATLSCPVAGPSKCATLAFKNRTDSALDLE